MCKMKSGKITKTKHTKISLTYSIIDCLDTHIGHTQCVFQKESLQMENIACILSDVLAAKNKTEKVLQKDHEFECQCQICHTDTHFVFTEQARLLNPPLFFA